MKNNSKFIALAQSVGLTAYVALVSLLLHNAERVFSPEKMSPILGPMVFLLVFIISALISASIMLWYPVNLFLKGEKKIALKIVIQSVLWLVVFIVVTLAFVLWR